MARLEIVQRDSAGEARSASYFRAKAQVGDIHEGLRTVTSRSM